MDAKTYYFENFDSSHAGGARWFDQKVSFDNLFVVSSAVNNAVSIDGLEWFTRQDIQQSASLNHAIKTNYGKPSLDNEMAANEYDKFIGQILNVLAFSGALESRTGVTRFREYRVQNQDLLNRITTSESEARVFLICYLEWVLRKFNWWHWVETYRDSDHTPADMAILKESFTALLIDTMGLGSRGGSKPQVEAGRIFQKVINLLAFQFQVPGIDRGRVSKNIPSNYELTYNRPNWRDVLSKKPKSQTRKEYELERELAVANLAKPSKMSSEMRKVRDYHEGVSEVPNTTNVKATHIHHIFPKSMFPMLADTRENLIAITPGQHLGEAHPNGNTSKIDPGYQKTCLYQKLLSVKQSEISGDGMYSYANFAKVLETGYGLSSIDPDFDSLKKAITDYIV